MPPLDAADNLGLLEGRRNPKWELRAKDHDRNHRGGAGHGGAGSGEQGIRAACGRPIHHRDRVAGPEAVAVVDAEACRAGDHVVVTVAICLGFASLAAWGFGRVGRSLVARFAAVPGLLCGDGDLAGRPWRLGRRTVGRTFQRRLAAARDAVCHRARQYHAQLLGDCADLRHARASRSRERQAEDRAAG